MEEAGKGREKETGKTHLQNELEKTIKQPQKPPSIGSEDELSEKLASILEEKKRELKDPEKEAKGEENAKRVKRKNKTKIFDEDEEEQTDQNQMKLLSNVKSTIVDKKMRNSRRWKLTTDLRTFQLSTRKEKEME